MRKRQGGRQRQKGGGPNFIRCFRIEAQRLGHGACFGAGKLAKRRETRSYLTYRDELSPSPFAACRCLLPPRARRIRPAGGKIPPLVKGRSTGGCSSAGMKSNCAKWRTEPAVLRPRLDSPNFGKLNRSNY